MGSKTAIAIIDSVVAISVFAACYFTNVPETLWGLLTIPIINGTIE